MIDVVSHGFRYDQNFIFGTTPNFNRPYDTFAKKNRLTANTIKIAALVTKPLS